MLATQTKIKDGNLAIDFDLFSVFLSTEQLIQVQVWNESKACHQQLCKLSLLGSHKEETP